MTTLRTFKTFTKLASMDKFVEKSGNTSIDVWQKRVLLNLSSLQGTYAKQDEAVFYRMMNNGELCPWFPSGEAFFQCEAGTGVLMVLGGVGILFTSIGVGWAVCVIGAGVTLVVLGIRGLFKAWAEKGYQQEDLYFNLGMLDAAEHVKIFFADNYDNPQGGREIKYKFHIIQNDGQAAEIYYNAQLVFLYYQMWLLRDDIQYHNNLLKKQVYEKCKPIFQFFSRSLPKDQTNDNKDNLPAQPLNLEKLTEVAKVIAASPFQTSSYWKYKFWSSDVQRVQERLNQFTNSIKEMERNIPPPPNLQR